MAVVPVRTIREARDLILGTGVKVEPLLEMAGDWRLFLAGTGEGAGLDEIRKHERTGSHLGQSHF